MLILQKHNIICVIVLFVLQNKNNLKVKIMDQHKKLINEIQFAQKHIEDAPKDTPHEILDLWMQDLDIMLMELKDIRKASRIQ